jgi:trehalose-phosphatase
VEHLFFAWQQVAAHLRAARHILLLSDYDGTLTPIVERPELANLSRRTKELLQALAHQHHFTVGIISGRALKDLQQRVGIRGIIYAGNHGLEIEGPGVSFAHPAAEEIKPVFRLLHQVLSKALGKVGGVLVEDKGLTLSVHYRMVSEDEADEVKNIFERIIAAARSLGKIRITSGKKVFEVRPAAAWDKGKAVALLLERYRGLPVKGKVFPIFLGDDLTDEDGFKVINECGGMSIFVGEEAGDTAARYILRSPAEVEEFLGMLLEHPGKGKQGV